MQNLVLQLQIKSLTYVDHQTLSENCTIGESIFPLEDAFSGEGIKLIR